MIYYAADFYGNSGTEWLLEAPSYSSNPDCPGGQEQEAEVSILKTGDIPDVSFTMGNQMILNKRAADLFENICAGDIDLIKINFDKPRGSEATFFWLKFLHVIDCIDIKKSGASRWKNGEIVAQKVGCFKHIEKLKLDYSLIPKSLHAFRTTGWSVGLIFSEEVKLVCESARLSGIYFSSV
jgi:hypothetical protein